VTATGRGSRARSENGPGLPGAGGATLRGALLIGVAVIVGIVLLSKAIDGGFLPSDSETPSEQADDADGDDDDGGSTVESSTTTTATPTTHVPAEVRVIVLNGGGPSGSAGTSSTAIAAAGFATVAASDTADVAATVVYATPGFEADAAVVAQTLGIAAPVQPMPATPPTGTPVGQVDVVVVLGPDFTPVG